MVFTTDSEQKQERKQHILLGEHKWCKGESPCLSPMPPGSPLDVDAQFGLILSLVCRCLYIARVVRAKNKNEVYMEF